MRRLFTCFLKLHAVVELAMLRLRPILMTSLTMILGAVPYSLGYRGRGGKSATDRLGDRRGLDDRDNVHGVCDTDDLCVNG